MPFTHYIIFGETKAEMADTDPSKAWKEFKEALKKNNLKMIGPFGPFGVKEGNCFILEGSFADFEGYIGSEAMTKCPLDRSRTISLFKPPWIKA
ncbi:MAG: hypothetical protein NWF07_06695 [Candidatus Bathyarchaeota archaeon]|nr:hypothetical protein [Candidatus Bathyarchaeota archaeon]